MGLKINENGHNSLYDRVKKLLVSCEWSDCSFSVSGQKFKAHKLILAVSSPVFEAMFYGPLSENEDINIIDIEPNIFQLLLNYIYTDKFNPNSIEDAYDMLYVSRKYMLENLTEMCITYIESNMGIDNVVMILNCPDYIQDNQLMSSALKLFCQHAEYLLKEYKRYITPVCMEKILLSDSMNISEKDLIKHVFEWTIQYCEQNSKNTDFQNRRDLLIKTGLMKLLRFFTLSVTDIEDIKESPNNLLLKDEMDIENFGINGATTDIFNSQLTPRSTLKLSWCLCHRAPIRSESPINIAPISNLVVHTRVKSNKTTLVNALIVQSRMATLFNHCNSNIYHEQFTVSVVCESNERNICNFNFKSDIEYGSNIDVNFIEPILLEKNVWYKISFKWPELNWYCSYLYAVESRDTYCNYSKSIFEFEDLTKSGGSFLRGLKFSV